MDSVFNGPLGDTLLLAIVLAFVAVVFWLGLRSYQTANEVRMRRAESFNRLLERFGTAKEFTEFLETEQGKQFLRDPMPNGRASWKKILRFVQFGIVFIAFGIGFLLNAYRLRDATDLHYYTQGMDCQFWGIFGVLVGVGLLVTALITYKLAKRWHLMNGTTQGQS